MAAQDLTSLANVKAFLQRNDTQQDPLIASLITRASDTIHRQTGREFAPATTSATRAFAYTGGGILDLYPYDVRSITAMTIDSDGGTPTTLVANTDYQLRPLPARDGVYQYLRLLTQDTGDPGVLTPGWPSDGAPSSRVPSERQISITGAWGFATVPGDIEHACIVTVVTWLRADVQAFSTSFSIDEGRLQRPEALPSAVQALLAPYRRVSVG
jgi:hypothetical protein